MKQTYLVNVTAKVSGHTSVTTYTIITPVGSNGMIYARDRIGRRTQARIIQVK